METRRRSQRQVSGKDPGMDHSSFKGFSMGERLRAKFLRQLIRPLAFFLSQIVVKKLGKSGFSGVDGRK